MQRELQLTGVCGSAESSREWAAGDRTRVGESGCRADELDADASSATIAAAATAERAGLSIAAISAGAAGHRESIGDVGIDDGAITRGAAAAAAIARTGAATATTTAVAAGRISGDGPCSAAGRAATAAAAAAAIRTEVVSPCETALTHPNGGGTM